MIKPDTVIGLILVSVAIAALTQAWSFASVPGMRFGAWTFPVFILSGLGACGVILIIKSMSSANEGVAGTALWPTFDMPSVIGFGLILAAGLFYILAADTLGFLISAAVIVQALSLWFWRRPLACAGLTVVTAPVAELVFAEGFSVPLPRGLLSITGLF